MSFNEDVDASRYFDNAATTPLDPRVREAMLPYLGEAFGNANSIHGYGLRAHEAVERAREQVALLIGAEDPSQILFTSGATESNNWVLNVADEVFVSPFEHSSMREPAIRRGARLLGNAGPVIVAQASSLSSAARDVARTWEPEMEALVGGIRNLELALERETDQQKRVELSQVIQEFTSRFENFRTSLGLGDTGWKPALLSLMAVNNEIGTIWHAPDYALASDLVHSDITQALGKLAITVEGLDYASFSAHKFYGPKGIGALYFKNRPPESLILGGEQELGARGGTLNVPAIVGMGAAAEIAREEQAKDYEDAQVFREILLDGLNGLSEYQINGGPRTSPFIVSVSFQGLEGETLVLDLDRAGYAISAGAACSSRSTEPSHVLQALSLEPDWIRGTVRVSFGRFNSKEETANLAKKLRSSAELLRTL